MGAIGLNPIRLDRIGLDPIRINAIKLGVPGAASGTDRPYIDPEVLASLKAVCICYGKSNDDPDRAVVKNLVDPDNPFVISNAAFKLNSGFGKYEVDFTVYNNQNVLVSPNKIVSIAGREFISLLPYTELSKTISSYKIKVTGLIGELSYWYRNQDGSESRIIITKDGIYQLSTCYNVENGQGSSVGFNGYSESSCTIEQIPSFEGAFVADGVDDLIISTKTAAEMGITDKVTVVSMIHQIDLNPTYNNGFTNYIENLDKSSYVRNNIYNTGKTGIYGYSASLINRTASNINDILGDKKDYGVEIFNRQNTLNSTKFSVIGRASGITEVSSVAWYWTIIANKVLTTDQINQVIAYFNLDRTLKPDILCDITRQGITNENHADFNDKLIDYSGNGRDIQMYNLAWKGGSGVAAKQYESLKDWRHTPFAGTTVIRLDEFSYNIVSNNGGYWQFRVDKTNEPTSQIRVITDRKVTWINNIKYAVEGESSHKDKYKTTIIEANTPTIINIAGFDFFDPIEGGTFMAVLNYGQVADDKGYTLTILPSCKGGILLDGVNDFGKVTGMPIYKDYTFIAEREFLSTPDDFVNAGSIVSKMHEIGKGSFIFETFTKTQAREVSFSSTTDFDNPNTERIISYQSKYSYNGKALTAGQVEDRDVMWLGTIRDNDTRFVNAAIYSLMLFPYSMSEFLIERQLKKHKLGTLYPDMVEFRPVIKANANYKITYYQIDSTNTWKSIKVGDYIVIGAKLAFQITFDNDASELKEVVSPQLSGIIVEKRPSDPGYYIYSYITSKSPQKINITIDEYIRFEDIVQPYPSLFTLIDYDTEEVYSWGSKLKVGARFKGDVVNLLPNMYEWQGNVLYNGEVLNWGIKPGVVAKEMVFSWNMPFKYLIDNNEPKVILSPRLLRIPNSSYKILGYIPDISGHGNHGVIHNSVYAKGSGVNEDGSYQFDGVNDFVTIPTLFSGGKQVLMKVNWDKTIADAILYDQRGYPNEFAIYNADVDNNNNPVFAYQARNNGQTYIDGILNKNIKASELRAITHNITITNELSTGTNTSSPVIGSNRVHDAYFTNMALYDFMLFDEISTDDKIKELNEYVGVEAKIELPPYYWDAYGKTNLDADKATIQQRGVAVGDYDITNYNHAYDKMSGYGGYAFAKFDNTNEWINDGATPMIISRNGYSVTLKKVSNIEFWRFINKTLTALDEQLTFKVRCDKAIKVIFQVKYFKNNSTDVGYNYNYKEITLAPNEDTTIIVPPISVSDIPEATSILFIAVLFDNTSLSDNEEYTIEMLPLYPNGLVYDGITDYSENANIPALTDYTYILKRQILKGIANSAVMYKGNITVNQGGAFICNYCEPSDTNLFTDFSFGGLLRSNDIDKPIIYGTKTSVNGDSITPGENIDTVGINVGKWVNYLPMVFYKLILYPKTIPLLQINFLKNLMEKDEIIDLNNKIFIQE